MLIRETIMASVSSQKRADSSLLSGTAMWRLQHVSGGKKTNTTVQTWLLLGVLRYPAFELFQMNNSREGCGCVCITSLQWENNTRSCLRLDCSCNRIHSYLITVCVCYYPLSQECCKPEIGTINNCNESLI